MGAKIKCAIDDKGKFAFGITDAAPGVVAGVATFIAKGVKVKYEKVENYESWTKTNSSPGQNDNLSACYHEDVQRNYVLRTEETLERHSHHTMHSLGVTFSSNTTDFPSVVLAACFVVVIATFLWLWLKKVIQIAKKEKKHDGLSRAGP